MASCARPLHAFRTGILNPTGGEKLFIKSGDVYELQYLDVKNRRISLVDYYEIPCGKCNICKANQARKKAERATAEAATWEYNEIINLTYNDQNLPYSVNSEGQHVATLCYKDFQLFKKRLLKHYQKEQPHIRFMVACEYGDKYQRPHYHAIFFNLHVDDKEFWGKTKKGSNEYRSATIEKLWNKGHVTLGDLDEHTINYVANYCLKKFKGRKAKRFYEKRGLEPERVVSSNRGGLGGEYIKKHLECYKDTGKAYAENTTLSTNKYFDKLLSDKYGDELLKEIKAKRQSIMEERERTRAAISGVDIQTQRENDERLFNEKIKKARIRAFN